MRITGYLRCKFFPCVPDLLLRETGELINKDRQVSAQMTAPSDLISFGEPIELQDGDWLVFMENGDPIPLALSLEPKWRADTAVRLLEAVKKPLDSGSPDSLTKFLEKTNLLLAAANLVGLNFQSLLNKIEEERKTPEESLESIVRRIIYAGK